MVGVVGTLSARSGDQMRCSQQSDVKQDPPPHNNPAPHQSRSPQQPGTPPTTTMYPPPHTHPAPHPTPPKRPTFFTPFSAITLALRTSFLWTGPMLMPLTGIFTSSESRKARRASREPRVEAWGWVGLGWGGLGWRWCVCVWVGEGVRVCIGWGCGVALGLWGCGVVVGGELWGLGRGRLGGRISQLEEGPKEMYRVRAAHLHTHALPALVHLVKYVLLNEWRADG